MLNLLNSIKKWLTLLVSTYLFLLLNIILLYSKIIYRKNKLTLFSNSIDTPWVFCSKSEMLQSPIDCLLFYFKRAWYQNELFPSVTRDNKNGFCISYFVGQWLRFGYDYLLIIVQIHIILYYIFLINIIYRQVCGLVISFLTNNGFHYNLSNSLF